MYLTMMPIRSVFPRVILECLGGVCFSFIYPGGLVKGCEEQFYCEGEESSPSDGTRMSCCNTSGYNKGEEDVSFTVRT